MDVRPRLEIIVVSYRSPALVRACLASLRAFAPPATLTHVVDNASGDETVGVVRDEFPEVRLHALDDNVGFSRANNIALRLSTAPYVLLLNPDTEVLEGSLEHMLGLMDARPDVGMSGCRLVQPNGEFDHAAKRGFPTPLSALGHFTGIGRRGSASGRLAAYRDPDLDEFGTGEVDAVNGAFMLVRREALESVGLLDEGYWLYMEDLDWCYAFHQRGWKVLYDGSVSVIHVKGGSAGQHRRPRQNIAFHRGMGRFYRKWYAGDKLIVDVAVYCGILGKLAISLTRSAVGRRLGGVAS